MNTLTVSPIQWSTLNDVDDVKPLNDLDTDCLVELRDVLLKHGKLERFGVALLHSHFDLASDEIMLESVDDSTRTLTTKPVKQSDAVASSVGTIWMLQEGDPKTMSWCRKYCEQKMFSHSQRHNKVPGS